MDKSRCMLITDLHDIKIGDLVKIDNLVNPLEIISIGKYTATLKGKKVNYKMSFSVNTGQLFVVSNTGRELSVEKIIKT